MVSLNKATDLKRNVQLIALVLIALGSSGAAGGSGFDYFDQVEPCHRCPTLGTFDGSSCRVATVPSGTTPFVWQAGFYYTPLSGNVCPLGGFDGANCYLGPVPSGECGYAYGDKLYLKPHCCPCPDRGRFDGANCYVATVPATSNPFIWQNQFYYDADTGNSCPIGTFDGAHCTLGHNQLGAVPFLLDSRFYLANACAHTRPEPQYFATQAPTTPPPIGEFCAPDFWFDGANCKLGVAPPNTNAFIYGDKFYHSKVPGQPLLPPWTSGPSCPWPAVYDGANCERHFIPARYSPFIYQNGWFTGRNPLYTFHSQGCPTGFNYDGANCYFGTAPSGQTASIILGRFVFNRSFGQSCDSLYPGSSTYLLTWCRVGSVPSGHQGFVYQNSWYVAPTPGSSGQWYTQPYGNGSPQVYVKPVCQQDDTDRCWHLVWNDEFDTKPDDQICYTADDRITCVYEPYWSQSVCTDSPTDWTTPGRAAWTASQHQRYDGVAHLDKCHWQVMDAYNAWEVSQQSSAYSPDNVHVEDGVLRLTNYSRPSKAPFDCGNLSGNIHSKGCAYMGASVVSQTWHPWLVNAGHSATNPDPMKRYTGRAVGPGGRIEFRARIAAMGHGAWPALWLFSDHLLPNSTETHNGELDALEFLADLGGPSDQIATGRATYGMAWQTAHDWTPSGTHNEAVAIPITVGEWHLYAVEWDDQEIRLYIDGCLRNKIREGQTVTDPWSGAQYTFHIPRDTMYGILMGNTASNSSHLPSWYRASLLGNGDPRPDFKQSELQIDYVRYYVKIRD